MDRGLWTEFAHATQAVGPGSRQCLWHMSQLLHGGYHLQYTHTHVIIQHRPHGVRFTAFTQGHRRTVSKSVLLQPGEPFRAK